jgi:hypothetical protein
MKAEGGGMKDEVTAILPSLHPSAFQFFPARGSVPPQTFSNYRADACV